MGKKVTDRVETLVGVNTKVRGETEVKGTLRVDGEFEGNIRADWVIIGETGRVKGDISAKGVIVGGEIQGNINADEAVEIRDKGRVLGDVSTKKLTIVEGGIFEGRSFMMAERESKIVDLQKKEQG